MRPKMEIKKAVVFIPVVGGWFIISVFVIQAVFKLVDNSNTDNPAILIGGAFLIFLTIAVLFISNIKITEFIWQKLKEKSNG